MLCYVTIGQFAAALLTIRSIFTARFSVEAILDRLFHIFWERDLNELWKEDKTIIVALNTPFEFQICRFISKSERLQQDWV